MRNFGDRIGRQQAEVENDTIVIESTEAILRELKLSRISLGQIDIPYYGSFWIKNDFVSQSSN